MAREKTPDRRLRRRNLAARMVEPEEEVSLTRRPDGEGPDSAIRAAVLASLLMGKSVSQIAIQYNLPYSTVRYWAERFDITNPVQRRDQLSEKLLTFVEAEIESLLAISLTTRDEDWILDQSASELAQFVAVKQDRLLNILAAYGRVTDHRNQLTAQIVEDDKGE